MTTRWYLSGYAPAKPQELINQERIADLKQNIANRKSWRQEINQLEEQMSV